MTDTRTSARTKRLGRAGAIRDYRNLQLADVVKGTRKLPAHFDVDADNPGMSLPMFANDVYGDCVIAGRAHQTLRFEYGEQGRVLDITDAEVVAEYMAETGGVDSGLAVLPSLRMWRRKGWDAAGGHYKIKAFAEIKPWEIRQLKKAICARTGVGIGLLMPLSAVAQTDEGRAWSVVRGRTSVPGSWGGHYVYVAGYNQTGPVCIAWGARQQMTWEFFLKYCDEAYAVIDAGNVVDPTAISLPKVEAFLSSL